MIKDFPTDFPQVWLAKSFQPKRFRFLEDSKHFKRPPSKKKKENYPNLTSNFTHCLHQSDAN